jgi:hypothetical protein
MSRSDVEGMFLAPGSKDYEVTANALGGRIRIRLRLDIVVSHPTDISLSCLVAHHSCARQAMFPLPGNMHL